MADMGSPVAAPHTKKVNPIGETTAVMLCMVTIATDINESAEWIVQLLKHFIKSIKVFSRPSWSGSPLECKYREVANQMIAVRRRRHMNDDVRPSHDAVTLDAFLVLLFDNRL